MTPVLTVKQTLTVTLLTMTVTSLVRSAQPDRHFELRERDGYVLTTLSALGEMQCMLRCAATEGCEGASYDGGKQRFLPLPLPKFHYLFVFYLFDLLPLRLLASSSFASFSVPSSPFDLFILYIFFI
jgi:hypothetical protein